MNFNKVKNTGNSFLRNSNALDRNDRTFHKLAKTNIDKSVVSRSSTASGSGSLVCDLCFNRELIRRIPREDPKQVFIDKQIRGGNIHVRFK